MDHPSNSKESKQFEQRQFASGSRSAPDFNDQFLEKLGFYRKHTPTDASCLFRVVCDLEHGVQIYHEKERKLCVEYMRKNRKIFAKDIEGNFRSYLETMALTRTSGTLLELKALAMYYDANVIIYEPLTSGRWFVQSEKAKTTWRLFRRRDNHFDSVYTLEYMREAAFCQGLVYMILYKNVFRMPDVDYAVERMLYDRDDTKTSYEQNAKGQTVATTADGRQLVMSSHEDTDCVLTNHQLCNFHNGMNFSRVQQFFYKHGNDAGLRVYGGFTGSNYRQGGNTPNPLLCDRNISCVRQLLKMNITPFAYKTAKALDANIYRNVAFDSWIDSLKMVGISRMNEIFWQVGMKCLCQIHGTVKVCRIVIVHPDSQTCMVRANNVSGLTCVRKEELRPYHPQRLGNRNISRSSTPFRRGDVRESPRDVNLAHRPAIKWIQPPAPFNEASPGLDTSAQMLMPMTMPVPTQSEIVNWQSGSEPMGSPMGWPMHQPNPTALMAPPIAMSPAAWQYPAPALMAYQQDLALEMHRQQNLHEQSMHQQILQYQQQQLQQLILQSQLQQLQLPLVIVAYQHNSNCPAHCWRYETVVPVDTTQQQQQAVGFEPIAGAGLAQHMHGAYQHLLNTADGAPHYLLNTADGAPHYLHNTVDVAPQYSPDPADSANSFAIQTTGATTGLPYTIEAENDYVYLNNIFFQ